MSEPEGTSGKPALGLRCPRCGWGHFETTHTQPVSGNRVRRRKTCRRCRRRIVTFEVTCGQLRPTGDCYP